MLAYLSRYTHRVAIGNRRILAANERGVSFAYKDYADDSRQKTMTLISTEFIHRFCLHVLPERFVKIRHYYLHLVKEARAKTQLDQERLNGERDGLWYPTLPPKEVH